MEQVNLVVLIFGLVLFMFGCAAFGRWLGRRLIRPRSDPSSTVVQMQSWRPKQKMKAARRRLPSPQAMLPGLLIGFAVLLLAFFQLVPYLGLNDTTLTGRVTHVRDGDTIEVNGQVIRLNGLTCDERGTPLGNQATMAMQVLASGEAVTCTLNGEQTYDREVGRCSLADGRDLGAELIRQGICGRCARYDPLRTYAALQQEAERFSGAYPGYCRSTW
ncbi:thermonuclease family protein [Flavimaricola marinus]|uniref:TNase-like domain-containing protein n=1 Tax=Flavimaricola marinus TaxID=1819565 RepID=A0A238LC99_9RHOB|nr:hypothetical protein [Flavimaricola marinus]SMY07248.1 hypothetical protein LOM8899_01381 [Flavimaricola marinus]